MNEVQRGCRAEITAQAVQCHTEWDSLVLIFLDMRAFECSQLFKSCRVRAGYLQPCLLFQGEKRVYRVEALTPTLCPREYFLVKKRQVP